MSTQKNEHNPDWTPNQYGAPDWRLLSRDEDTQQDGDEWWDWEDGRWMLVEPHMFGKRPLVGLTYRRRITPPTDTTGSGREGEMVPKDHVIDRSAPIETQLAQAEVWIAQLQQSYRSIQQTCTNKDAQVEALRRDGERLEWVMEFITENGTDALANLPWTNLADTDPMAEDELVFDRAAIDSAQREEGERN